jgi:anti-sigma B factor antagonist
MFDIQVGDNGSVRLSGRLDANESDRALEVLRGLEGPLVLDCSELDYISSAGIGVLIETYKRLHASGRTLRLVHMLPRVRNVFVYAGLDRVLTIE